MINRECLKGWILAPSPTDGENVPFFVYVRDKDIIWDADMICSDFKAKASESDKEIVFGK